MQASFWTLGIAGMRLLGGLQGALIQTEGGRLQGRGRPVFGPFSTLLLEGLGTDAKEDCKRRYLQELVHWCYQLVERVVEKNDIMPDVLSFDGFEEMGGTSLLRKDLKVVAKALEQKFHKPVVYDFQVQTAVEQERNSDDAPEAVRKAAYYAAVLAMARASAVALRRHARVAIVELGSDITVYFPKEGQRGEELWTCARVWPGLDCMDEWTMRSFQKTDEDGVMASRGLLLTPLLSLWLREAEGKYKSPQEQTDAFWNEVPELVVDQTPLDICTTLTAFTAQRVVKKLKENGSFTSLVLVGRGRHNVFLKSCLNRAFSLLTPRDLLWDETLSDSESCAYNAIRCLTKAPAALTGNPSLPFMTAKAYDPSKLFPRSAFRANRTCPTFDRIVKS